MILFVPLDYSFFTLYAGWAKTMEPHPIPQNVTSFEFHLVGDMTLKQFMYLATGSAIAYFLFVFLAPIYPLVAWPLIIISALAGVAFAFLPINSRPLDHWVKAFLKAVYSPTKRRWEKNGRPFSENSIFNSRLNLYLTSLQPTQIQPPYPQPNLGRITQPGPAKPIPTTEELGKTVDLARQAQNLQLKILQNERQLSQIKAEAQKPTAIPIDYSNQVNKILADLQILMGQASQIRGQLDKVTKSEVKPKEKIKVISPVKSKQTQLALTTFPNVINGVVKDKAGNYLEGCIAVIHDKEGLPVRALKTNKLGQFTGSTPLPNGSYKLTVEKENFVFDVLQIDLSGEVLPPLFITAK